MNIQWYPGHMTKARQSKEMACTDSGSLVGTFVSDWYRWN